MAIPKLEFYKFKLNHKTERFKSFRDFIIDEYKKDNTISNEDSFKECFTLFMSKFHTDFAKDEKRKKAITLISDSSYNEHLDKKPNLNTSKYIIQGVINGGSYGKKRILADIDNKENNSKMDAKKTALNYYYIFIYLPPDHNEGFFMVHSNGSDETITAIFRDYVTNLFKKGNYNKPNPEIFCPSSFQEEYRKDALIKTISFSTTIIDDIPNEQSIKNFLNNYKIKIEATPTSKDVNLNKAEELLSYFSKKLFNTGNKSIELEKFTTKKLHTQNEVTKTPKVFEWNTKDAKFAPVIYLDKSKIVLLEDNTPDFISLKKYCLNLFESIILEELRPDYNVVKVK